MLPAQASTEFPLMEVAWLRLLETEVSGPTAAIFLTGFADRKQLPARSLAARL